MSARLLRLRVRRWSAGWSPTLLDAWLCSDGLTSVQPCSVAQFRDLANSDEHLPPPKCALSWDGADVWSVGSRGTFTHVQRPEMRRVSPGVRWTLASIMKQLVHALQCADWAVLVPDQHIQQRLGPVRDRNPSWGVTTAHRSQLRTQ